MMLRISLLFIFLILSGCSITPVPRPDDPFYAPSYPVMPATKKPTTGAIYNANTSNFLLEDEKARRVGDILLVNLTETTSASKNADTKLKKADSVSIPNPTLFGRAPSLLHGDYNLQQDIAPKRSFEGKTDSSQSNNLSGSISVTVVQVYPNGYMLVRGEKWITLNQGREYIRLTGIVRPQDIAADNTINSTRIGNAKIAYSGTGELADANHQGWLSRFFSSNLWPF